MKSIVIISASVRDGRNSHRVALFLKKFLAANLDYDIQILDLKEYNFPLFHERLAFQKEPAPAVLEFAQKVKESEAVIIVTPEYNGGYPASLKNVVDLLYEQWYHKPIGVATVSDGPFAGTQVITSLLFTLWKIKAWVIPGVFPVSHAHDSFDETGAPKDEATVAKRAHLFLKELKWALTLKKAAE